MTSWNETLFLLVNASADPDPVAVLLAKGLADGSVPGAVALMIVLWVWGEPNRRGALLTATAGLVVAMAINVVIGMAWFHPRPFMLGLGHQLLAHAPETSFPSDHATFLWSLGFGLVFTGAYRLWGWLLVVLAGGVAWARVFLGVHFPFDMAGSLIVALGGAGLARSMAVTVERRVLPPVTRLYGLVLRLLHLPAAIVPRHVEDE